MSAYSNWLDSVNGQPIEMDTSWGPQCWDLWAHYCANLIGVDPWWLAGTNSGGGCPDHPGFTCGIWYGFGGNLNPWFTQVQGTPQRGDVAIWEFGSAPAPLSHVAMVIEDAGDSVYCMTQNPGAAHYAHISKSGILGYLRPDNQSFFDGPSAPAPAPGVSGGGKERVIIPGDTLWDISAQELGDPTRYMEIFNASNFRSGNPDLIFPGEIAVIP